MAAVAASASTEARTPKDLVGNSSPCRHAALSCGLYQFCRGMSAAEAIGSSQPRRGGEGAAIRYPLPVLRWAGRNGMSRILAQRRFFRRGAHLSKGLFQGTWLSSRPSPHQGISTATGDLCCAPFFTRGRANNHALQGRTKAVQFINIGALAGAEAPVVKADTILSICARLRVRQTFADPNAVRPPTQ